MTFWSSFNYWKDFSVFSKHNDFIIHSLLWVTDKAVHQPKLFPGLISGTTYGWLFFILKTDLLSYLLARFQPPKWKLRPVHEDLVSLIWSLGRNFLKMPMHRLHFIAWELKRAYWHLCAASSSQWGMISQRMSTFSVDPRLSCLVILLFIVESFIWKEVGNLVRSFQHSL